MEIATKTHLVTEPGKLQVRAQGPAIAGIWLVTGGVEFPMVGWSDFVVVILRWLSAAILRSLRNNAGVQRVHFMDGPYAVDISTSQSETLQFRMFAGPGGGREIAAGEANMKTFANELATQSRELLDECKRREWWSPDAEALALHLHDLDRELVSWKNTEPA